MTNKIVVLGSINLDIVLHTERLPKIGETIVGKGIDYLVGGKGSNQAVASARSGGDVALLGKIGGDTSGEKILSYLKDENMDLSHLTIEPNSFTGIASIFKLPADNCITVISGANELVNRVFVDSVSDVIKGADILLMQLEIPVDTVKYALEIAKQNHVTTVVNPAPFKSEILEALDDIDYITPNEIEFEALCHKNLETEQAFFEEMLSWSEKHSTKLIVTRGEAGVSFVENGKVETIPAYPVEVVDTTGAGDAFNGIFASAIAKGLSTKESIRFASSGASMSTRALGAQTGIPTFEEIENYLKEQE